VAFSSARPPANFSQGSWVALVFSPIDRMVRVSLRQEALEVPPQDSSRATIYAQGMQSFSCV